MKIYITKYALTQGIFTAEGEATGSPGRMCIKTATTFQSFSKNDWAPDRGSALKQAEEKQRKKIDSLRKQIAKLEQLKIEVHE